jgi:hypothetical protein
MGHSDGARPALAGAERDGLTDARSLHTNHLFVLIRRYQTSRHHRIE